MRIQHNILAMNAYRNYNTNTSALAKNLEKLSSGYKINRAGDDAAGLAISEKMRAQITGLNAAQKNVKDGISLVKTAEGAMQEIQDMLNRMDYLATQSANGTYDNEVDRAALQKEVDQLRSEINRIADSANFNGISLLDGSLDNGKVTTTTAASAISDITDQAYSPKGASEAFSTKFIEKRPEAPDKQTNAEFVVTFDDIDLKGVEADDVITLKIGETTLSYKVTATDIAGSKTLDDFINMIATKGGADLTPGTKLVEQDNNDVAKEYADTDTWAEAYAAESANIGSPDDGGKYILIDGHYYKMTKEGASSTGDLRIKFEQVDTIGDGNNVNPSFSVSLSVTDGGGAGTKEITKKGDSNWQVQQTVTGVAIGSTQQARVSVAIDFAKLKDGDTFTAGEKVYRFKIGEDSSTTNGAGETLIDLSKIFAQESDLEDAQRQKDALDAIVKTMGGSDTWSAGNAGVVDGVGTITFQSKSTYKGDATGAADNTKKYIGGNTNAGICDMKTEASVLKQFFGESEESGASTSFTVDVTKIKVGDTFTIDNKTFEFTDGSEASNSKNVAIDLSSFGISTGLLASQSGDILKEIQTAIQGGTNAAGKTVAPALQIAGGSKKYDVTIDGNTIKLSAQDDTSTPTFENRLNATILLPTETTTGKSLQLQIGDTSKDYNQLQVSIGDMHVEAMKIDTIAITDSESAAAAIDVIKSAINYVSSVRGDLGATQNRLEHTANNLSVMAENIQDAESTIRDTDVAEEMMAYTKNNILIQSAQAMLAQANAIPQGVLQLLG